MKKEDAQKFIHSKEVFETIKLISLEAAHLHDDECNQKYDIYNYSYHLNMVAELAKENLHEVCQYEHHILPIVFAAYFHDAIEDARQTYNDIMKRAEKYMTRYQAMIATEIVYALTDEKGRNRKERASEKHFEGIRNTKYAPFVKWCDRYGNVKYSIGKGSRMAVIYQKEMPEFINMLGGDKYLSQGLIDKIFDLACV